ncbi:MAG TPA: tetratricopeptide repeat protein [Kofleriaceae bacterium]
MYGFYGWGIAIVIFQIICIVHAVRTDRTSWIWIILFFPLIGSVIYLASEVRFSGRAGAGRKLAGQLVDVVQPSRKLQALRAEVEACSSVENRLALAEECVRHKLYDEALQLYDSASTGVHKNDPAVLKMRAVVQFEMGKHADARATLEQLFESNPRERSPGVRLLFARIVEAQGDTAETLEAYEAASPGSLGDEARCRYAGALERAGRRDEAFAIYTRIVKESARGDARYRRDNREWIQIAKTKVDQTSASRKPA